MDLNSWSHSYIRLEICSILARAESRALLWSMGFLCTIFHIQQIGCSTRLLTNLVFFRSSEGPWGRLIWLFTFPWLNSIFMALVPIFLCCVLATNNKEWEVLQKLTFGWQFTTEDYICLGYVVGSWNVQLIYRIVHFTCAIIFVSLSILEHLSFTQFKIIQSNLNLKDIWHDCLSILSFSKPDTYLMGT